MFVKRSVMFPGLLVATLLISVCPVVAAQHQLSKPAPKHQEPVVDEDKPQPTLTPEQRPADPPQVTFQNGMLTIVSQNSTLGDILRAVHTRTGAAIDMPPNATERVVANLGPGPARDVLATLLNGSHFNYVMLGSATDARALDRIILTPKTSAAAAGSVDASLKPPPAPANQVEADDDDDSADADDDDTDTPEDAQADQNGQGGDEDQPQQVQPVGQGQSGLPNVRTPEQILQQMRQQQLQQQQGQPGTPPGQPAPQPFPGQPNPNQPPN